MTALRPRLHAPVALAVLALIVVSAEAAHAQRPRPGSGSRTPTPISTTVSSAPAPVATAPSVFTPTDILGGVTVESPAPGGWEAKMTVTLSRPAPETNPDSSRRCRGVFILTESSHPAIAPVPASLCLQPGETTETFEIRTTGVAETTPVTISARYLEFPARSATLEVLAPAVDRIEVSATAVTGGDTIPAVLHFTGPPPASPPMRVYLGSADPAVASVPTSVPMPANALSAPFKIVTHAVSADTEVRIRASLEPLPSAPAQSGGGGGGIAALGAVQPVAAVGMSDVESVKVTVLPPQLEGVWGPSQASFTARLTGPAPKGGVIVAITSQRPDLVAVPPSITVPEGRSVGEVPVVISAPSRDKETVRLTGTYDGVTKWFEYKILKPDLAVRSIVLKDRYGNAVTTPVDGQPLTMCASVESCSGCEFWSGNGFITVLVRPPTSVLHYDYRTYHPQTETTSGRQGDLTVDLGSNQPVCTAVAGVEDHGWMEIDLLLDPANQIPEQSETNNDKSIKVTRP